MEQTLFWNVDTQKDFMLPDGKLYIKEAETIIPALGKLTKHALNHNIRVVNTCDYHTLHSSKELSDNPDFVNTFPPHCIAGTEGAEFILETYPKERSSQYYICRYTDSEIDIARFGRARNIIIEKDAFDVFSGNPHTEELVKLLDPKLIVVYGVASNVCVNFAVMGLLKRGYKVAVIEDAIKGLPNLPDPIEDWKKAGASMWTLKLLGE